MYKLVLVDDEQIVREGVADTIDWASLGFEFAGAFENGADADRAIDRIVPAVVITDICMPFGDGLELTEQISEKHPATKVILLSGFDEFEYAQRAVRLGAYDYVLKPITAAELRALLKRVRADLDAETRRSEELEAMSQTLERARGTRLAGLTERIMSFPPTDGERLKEEVALALRDSGIEPPTRWGSVLAVCVDLDSPDREASGNDAIPGRENRVAASFLDHAHRSISIVSDGSESECAERARTEAQSILSGSEGPGAAVTVGIGSPFAGSGGFAASYREAVCCLEYRFVAGLGRSIEQRDVPEPARRLTDRQATATGEWSPRFRSAVAEIVRALRACDASDAASSVGRLVSEMRRDFVSRAQCDLQIHSCLVQINELASELGQPPISIESFTSLSTVDAVGRLLDESCAAIIRAQVEHGESFGGVKTREAVEYIEQNYASPRLSLTSLCAEIAVSSSYFSSVFKRHTAKTFVEYLTEVRVDRAKKLLKTTDLRIYEIARRVGYRDQHYFCTIFKKTSGRSPLEFRRDASVPQR